jgi:hypothetical protein
MIQGFAIGSINSVRSLRSNSIRALCAAASAVLLLALTLCVATASAQVPTGSIVGTVQDIQGLAVGGADVVLTSQGTNHTYTAVTSSTGSYQFSSLDFGLYRVSTSKSGFKAGVVQNIKLDASTVATVPPITLEVGGAAESVVVEAGAESIEANSAEVSDTVEKKQIEELPILDRQALGLVQLEPGVANAGPNTGNVTTINGQRTSFTNVTLDGINIQDNFIRQNSVDFFPNLPFSSQAAEFTIINQNGNVDAGGGASQVSIVTPQGTNLWHGQGFWYYRTNAWAANDWFNNNRGIALPNLLQNQGGVNFAGPIKKDKLFIYGYYELFRRRQSAPSNTTILSPAIRAALTASTPTLPFQYIPNGSSTPVTEDLLAKRPSLTLDPAITALLQNMPGTPNNLAAGDTLNTLGFSFNARSNETRDNYGLRGDYNLNSHNTFTGTWAWNRQIVDRPDIDTSFNKVPIVSNNDSIKFLAAAWRFNPSSTFTNEVRFGFNLAPAFFLTSQKFGNYVLDDTSLAFTDPNPNFFPQGRNTRTYSYQDNANLIRGNHTFKFGGQLQRVTIFETNSFGIIPAYTLGFSNSNPNGLQTSDFTLGTISSTDLNNANALLASLTGVLSQVSQTFNATSQKSGYVANAPENRNFRQNNWALFAGDTWKIRRNVTFIYGVRWDYFSPVDEKNGLILLPVIPSGQTATQALLSDATVDFAGGPSKRRLYNPRYNQFAPNIGMAWDPFGNGKMAVRAGYSINYVNDAFFTAAQNAASGNSGLATAPIVDSLNGPTVSSPVSIPSPPFGIPTTFSQNQAIVGTQANAGYAIEPNLKTPYVQQWNLSVERNIGWNTTLTASYVGNRGTGLFRAIDVNQVIINPNGFLADFNRARANGFLAATLPANPNPAPDANGCTGPGTQNQCGFFNPIFSGAGSQPLTIFPNICGPGGFGAAGPTDFSGIPFINNDIQQGVVGSLADVYHIFGCSPSNGFFAANEVIRGGDLLTNASFSTYHSGVLELRRRFEKGLYFQANYVYSKVLTDYGAFTNGDQFRFQPFFDNLNRRAEKGRAPFDITHQFKANFTYELPIGKGHNLSPSNHILSFLVSGWNTASIFTWQSGAPFSILSTRGTINRAGTRSVANTAVATQSHGAISGQLGVFPQANGVVYIINPKLINPNGTGAAPDALSCSPLVSGGFCNPQPGERGNLQVGAFSGPAYFDWDLSVGKDFHLTERLKLNYRAQAFNVLNHPTFFAGDQNINNSTFGQSTSTASLPRVLQMSLTLAF